MNRNRRSFLWSGGILGAGWFASRKAAAQDHDHSKMKPSQTPMRADGFLPVQTPDLPKLPYEIDDGVKVFNLVAEPVRRIFLPASSWSDERVADVWGYNGSMPGPTIEVIEGDRLRIHFTNKLPEPTAPHWHGLEVPMNQDGVPGIGQNLIMPGETYTYEFMLHQHGTFFYHSHMAMQEMMGMIGLFIVHPRTGQTPRVDRDFGVIMQEWAILPNNTVPNTLAMEFNWLTFNGKAGPDCTPLIVRHGDRVRIRLVNLGMDHHPIHLHGNQFYVTGTEGGRIPESAWYPGNTVLVGVAQARDIEFEAKHLGDWMLHCHLPHHMMNQMVSMVGPMAHVGHGMKTGGGMEEGMGMISGAHALSDDLGPTLGRGMSMATIDRPVSNAVGQQAQEVYACPMHPDVKSDKPGQCPKCGMALTTSDPKRVKGYPQDMWMTMDEAVIKPENSWLPQSWTGAMMGMMTLVRVLPPDKYDRMMTLIKEGKYEPGGPLPGNKGPQPHHHGD